MKEERSFYYSVYFWKGIKGKINEIKYINWRVYYFRAEISQSDLQRQQGTI